MKKPIIGLLSNSKTNYDPSDMTSLPRNETFVQESYIQAIEKNGGTTLIIHPTEDEDTLLQLMKLCDGFLFPGGFDIDPKLYGENPHKRLGIVNPKNDATWYYCAKYVIEQGIPTLGICRGMQMLNIAAGGTLFQDIDCQIDKSFQHVQKLSRSNLIHRIHIEKGSRLSVILGVDSIFTNSFHHQSVKDIGLGFIPTAYTEDGVIEAMESEDGTIIGVQWHPEDLIENEERMNYLFENLCLKSMIAL